MINLLNKICLFLNVIYIFEEKICIFCFINLSYKSDFIPNILSSQSKDKAYTQCLRKCVKTSPPLDAQGKLKNTRKISLFRRFFVCLKT